MSTTQDSVQVQLPEALSRPFLALQDFTGYVQNQEESSSASSALHHPSPAPIENEDAVTENEAREPLKEVTKSTKGNLEVPDQEQENEGEEKSETGDKLTDYVAKVLEKLVNQRNKMSKLSAVLEKKGLVPEKKISQELEELISKDAEEEEEDDNSKENLSPIARIKQVAPVQEKNVLAAIPQRVNSKITIEDVLQISRNEIYYGNKFPGQVAEEGLEIVNKSGQDFVVQIIVSCLNEELNDTEEYVYSVRRSHLYDYNDKHYLIMAPYSCAGFKFALKVPNLKLSGRILGQVKISIQGVSGCYILDLAADVSVPKVFCPKELRVNGLEYPVIKLAIKEGKKSEIKIPIRNSGDVPVTLEFEFYEPKENHQERAMYDCMVHPNVVTINPNSTALTSILIKPWKVMMTNKGLNKQKATRKILVGRVRDSALIYSFVFWIEMF